MAWMMGITSKARVQTAGFCLLTSPFLSHSLFLLKLTQVACGEAHLLGTNDGSLTNQARASAFCSWCPYGIRSCLSVHGELGSTSSPKSSHSADYGLPQRTQWRPDSWLTEVLFSVIKLGDNLSLVQLPPHRSFSRFTLRWRIHCLSPEGTVWFPEPR